MEIKINIKKRHFFILAGLLLILWILVFVRAFGTNNPSNFGHSVGEMDWSQAIPSNVNINGNLGVNGQALIQGRRPFTQSIIVNSAWSGSPPDIRADCPAEYQLIGGSCEWQDTDNLWSNALSYPDANGWRCQSADGSRRARAYAFCLSP